MPTLAEVLQPQVILEVVSRIRPLEGRFARWLGFLPTGYNPEAGLTGPNVKNSPTRYAAYRIFDSVRTVAQGRVPGTGPATKPPNPIGQGFLAGFRGHEKICLDWEQLGNLSPLSGPNAQVDSGGQDYISKQEYFLAQKFYNLVEFLSLMMAKGAGYIVYNGDDQTPTFTQPSAGTPFESLNWQVPAGNTLQLNMLGGGNLISGTWKSPSATIISDLAQIRAAFQNLHGWPLKHIWLNSAMWYFLITNTEIRNVGGSANVVFAEYSETPERAADGKDYGDKVARLRAFPDIEFHIDDSWIDDNGTLVKKWPDGFCGMYPDMMGNGGGIVGSMIAEMIHTTEYVSEQMGQVASPHAGYHFWTEWVTQPSCIELLGLMNLIPALYVPKAIVYANPFT